MKHTADQLEIPGTESAFNLIGEIMEPVPDKPLIREDRDTGELFEFDDTTTKTKTYGTWSFT